MSSSYFFLCSISERSAKTRCVSWPKITTSLRDLLYTILSALVSCYFSSPCPFDLRNARSSRFLRYLLILWLCTHTFEISPSTDFSSTGKVAYYVLTKLVLLLLFSNHNLLFLNSVPLRLPFCPIFMASLCFFSYPWRFSGSLWTTHPFCEHLCKNVCDLFYSSGRLLALW